MCYCMKMKIIMITKRTINTKLKINTLSVLPSCDDNDNNYYHLKYVYSIILLFKLHEEEM